MKQETYKTLKKTPEYRAYIALGMSDTTTEKQLKNGIISFEDEAANCNYIFNSTTGYVRRTYWRDTGIYFFNTDVKISYQLNPREKVPGRGGDISWTRTFPNNMKKLLSIGLTPAIRYNGKRRITNNKRLLNTVGNMLS